jgi:hypothetical protein
MYDNSDIKIMRITQIPETCLKFRCRSAVDAVSAHKIPLPSEYANRVQSIDFDDMSTLRAGISGTRMSNLPELRESPGSGVALQLRRGSAWYR